MSAKLLKYSTVCERLDISKTFLYGLIASGMLEKKTLPGLPNEEGKQSKENRITLESIERYERGEAKPAKVTTAAGAGPRKKISTPRPKPLAHRVARAKHFH